MARTRAGPVISVVRRAAPSVPPRVLLTRDEEGCRSWAAQLAQRSIEAVCLPCLEHSLTHDSALIGRFLETVRRSGRGDWLVFTSRRGVEAAARRLGDAGLTPPDTVGLAAVGPATASTCRAVFGRCDLAPPDASARGEALAAILRERPPAKALLCVAQGGRTDLEDTLRPAGWSVERFDLYATRPVTAPDAGEETVAEQTLAVDAVFLASPSAVSGLLNCAEVHPDVPLLAIGPTTATTLEAAGRPPSGVARSPGLGPLIQLFFDLDHQLHPEPQPSLETSS